jgi:signal peptidase II
MSSEDDAALPRSRAGAGLAVAVVTLVLDQASKLWLIYGLGMKVGDKTAITPFLDILFTINYGVSYGLFQLNSARGQLFLTGFSVIVALLLAVWLFRGRHSGFMAMALGLIIGGAIGNAVDRLHIGGVADFVSLHAFGYYWYIFNVADVAIVAGIIGLLYDSVMLSRNGAAKGT